MKGRYLTKSRFKLAMECPTKLFYTGKDEYANRKLEDPFLEALADGGFQVGELAKFYFPGGYNVEPLDYDEALKETNQLLRNDSCIIFEGAVSYDNLFIRADILVKDGNDIKIIEVKAKSAREPSANIFLRKRGNILLSWRPYLDDIAFQKYVATKAFPDHTISAYLMLVDKSSKCPTDGLNQKFKISRTEAGRKYIVVAEKPTAKDLSIPILTSINVDEICEIIYGEDYHLDGKKVDFQELVRQLAEAYRNDKIIPPQISKACKQCEFRASVEEMREGLKSGFHECLGKELGLTEADVEQGTIFDIWNFRQVDKLIAKGAVRLSEINKNDIGPRRDCKAGLSLKQRQWLQIAKVKDDDSSYWLDKADLLKEMEQWKWPLHFIDFETAAPAIPFNKGRHPYEGIAFQFSHHIIHENGEVEHKGEYLNANPGVFPNYEFVRELKGQLEQDEGTIFRYAAHENTYLNLIYGQLQDDESGIEDKDGLCGFIREITEYKDGREKIIGPRNMVDMHRLVKRYYYDPYMGGSNSIKVVLPAIMNSSDYIKEKYSEPIYGSDEGIPSLNYKDWNWVRFEEGKVIDPYRLLPKLFSELTDKDCEAISFEGEITSGGAAMTAYARLQFEEMPTWQRREMERALLKYCELDTLAMVMLYEGWRDMLS
ncbi:MAG TPA: DUF2779 domain-containing protein [Clostridia bacterium]|nr:DUF2779 domain-containing protein [Clostridia bacterium]